MPEVAFCRSLKVGKQGKDVIGHKRALSRAAPDLYPWLGSNFTAYYGPRFADAVGKWQKRKGMEVTERIGLPTHNALEKAKAKNKPTEPAFDSYADKLCADFCNEFTETTREKVVEAGFFWYYHRSGIAYSQYRPFWLGNPPGVPKRWDCSGFVTGCYFAGGAKDPNGRRYDGYGYTGTLIENGTKISREQLLPGDLIFYGFVYRSRPAFPYGSPTHVAMYVGNDMVLSHGSYPMGYYHYRYRHDINHYRTYNI
jgi:hypothetical protein